MSAVIPGVKFSQFIGAAPLSPVNYDQTKSYCVGVDANVDQKISAQAAIFTSILQVAHGLTRGLIVRINNAGLFVRAQADIEANSNVTGIITSVVSVDKFVILTHGFIPTGVVLGLTPGSLYYLSQNVPGAFAIGPPVAPGTVVKPLFTALSATQCFFQNQLGVVN